MFVSVQSARVFRTKTVEKLHCDTQVTRNSGVCLIFNWLWLLYIQKPLLLPTVPQIPEFCMGKPAWVMTHSLQDRSLLGGAGAQEAVTREPFRDGGGAHEQSSWV